MTDPLLTAIKARLENATTRPWALIVNEDDGAWTVVNRDPQVLEAGCSGIIVCRMPGYDLDERDGEFIAHAPEDIAYLLTQLQSATARATQAEQERDELQRAFCGEVCPMPLCRCALPPKHEGPHAAVDADRNLTTLWEAAETEKGP